MAQPSTTWPTSPSLSMHAGLSFPQPVSSAAALICINTPDQSSLPLTPSPASCTFLWMCAVSPPPPLMSWRLPLHLNRPNSTPLQVQCSSFHIFRLSSGASWHQGHLISGHQEPPEDLFGLINVGCLAARSISTLDWKGAAC